jgi:hypothetical protein
MTASFLLFSLRFSPKMNKKISASKAKWILRKSLKSRIFWTRKILLFDKNYELVDESKLDLTSVRLGSGSDCDERAFVMMGQVIEEYPKYLFGFVEGYDKRDLKHAWCFFMNESKQVRYVEPSTAKIFSPTSEQVYHFIR